MKITMVMVVVVVVVVIIIIIIIIIVVVVVVVAAAVTEQHPFYNKRIVVYPGSIFLSCFLQYHDTGNVQ